MRTWPISFAVELDRYTPRPRRDPHSRQVFFYARPPTPRRAFELGLLVLAEVARRRPDVKFILAGWDVSQYVIPFDHLALGSIALDDLPDLYSQCDAALVLSCTNLSLLPLELMACGCPVVSNRGPNVEWLLNQDVALLADFTVEDLGQALVALLEDEPRRRRLIERGLQYARNSGDWHIQAQQFAKVLKDIDTVAGQEEMECSA
jgi:glycosyltransferase involved in cell wall biosynthesis